jgi:hypothetical protein
MAMKRFGLVAACAGPLLCAGHSIAGSQDAVPTLRGACSPVVPGGTEWDCAIVPGGHLEDIKCNSGPPGGLEAGWQKNRDVHEAVRMFQQQYETMDNLNKFVQWLACQGFRVNITQERKTDGEYGKRMKLEAVYFSDRMIPFPVNRFNLEWLFGMTKIGNMYLRLDQFGQVESSSHYYVH